MGWRKKMGGGVAIKKNWNLRAKGAKGAKG